MAGAFPCLRRGCLALGRFRSGADFLARSRLLARLARSLRRPFPAAGGALRAIEFDAFGKQVGRAPTLRTRTGRDVCPIGQGPSMRPARATEASPPSISGMFCGKLPGREGLPPPVPAPPTAPSTSASGDALTGRRKRDLVSPASDAEVRSESTPLPRCRQADSRRGPLVAAYERAAARAVFCAAPRQ